ncbi:threonine/serine exporter family protein [Campylobacter insulaenigrae]|uniref:Threonine/serine exporter family protein n=1 Tax=Campylobacter insulaenigrae TaxID=260714 RepID=A0ABY3G3Q6_9BACT|nr:threonine/serine exporter family protein [Campylobacter insulaenigrae]MCR6571436.1 threonine/serine exporter family protein [Campylobacter insulaenigrae]MCR6571606.1 threonine/serine exporter family protein [Campylobacter insulaenigrae]MCR6574598.1 threonine/serine exporter family protein [Campylobacter insulaenigrae]MCR6576167.1 threonine/serine exporter family protein [Campylobacter insulaenigrae]MCR6577254.1 threonine/serine exporter family protein [Campylobacter insulaenigrae]
MIDYSSILWDMLFAAITGFGFAYACNPPLKTLFLSALLAAIAHSLRFTLINYFGFETLAISTFIASFTIGCIGLFLAKIFKTPAEIIAFPALIPMIPGIYAYKAILYLISFIRTDEIKLKTEFLIQFFDYFFTTLSVTLALAVGVSVTLLLFFEQSFMMTRNIKNHDQNQS